MKQGSVNRISTCIRQVQEVKTQIKSKITEYFVEFKKKVVLSMEKAERSIMAKINDACTSSIDALSKLNNVELNIFEIQKYECQTNKLVESIKFLNVDSLLKGIIDQIKYCVDQTRKIKVLQELPKITQEKEIVRFDKTIKVQNQPIQRLSFVNKKLVEICENSVTIQKNTINKKFDYVLPIKIQNKQKQILFVLHEGTIWLYNDKLTLHSFKKFDYSIGNIVKAYQIRNYVIVAEHNKINRVNLKNLNEIFVKTFKQEVTSFGQQMYKGYLVVGFVNRIALMDFDTLEEVAVINFIGRVKNIFLFKQSYIIIALSLGIKIYKNLQEIELGAWSNNWTILEEIKCYQETIYATSQSFLFSICIEKAENGGQTLMAKKINEAQTKMIKSVASRGYEIFCLGTNGKKIYVYSF